MENTIRDQIREKVQSLLQDKNKQIGDNDPLVTSGLLNSLRVVELATWLEQDYQMDFSAQHFNIYDFESIAKIIDLVQKRRPD